MVAATMMPIILIPNSLRMVPNPFCESFWIRSSLKPFHHHVA
jgi:hypothetical protein